MDDRLSEYHFKQRITFNWSSQNECNIKSVTIPYQGGEGLHKMLKYQNNSVVQKLAVNL